MKLRTLSIACASVLATSFVVAGDVDLRELYQGDFRVEQDDIGNLTRNEIRLAGMRMFTTPFRLKDGYGDGDDNPPSPTPGTNHEGERGSIQGNGTFQRINGLDAQTCLECHSIVSNRKVPAKFGIGGIGGVNSTVMGAGGATFVDLTTTNKQQNINGRVINPPFIFGAGGIELLANEMTRRLNNQLDGTAPGQTKLLQAKGVPFGSVTRNPDGSIKTFDHDGDPSTEEIAEGVEGVFDLRPLIRDDHGNLVANTDFLVVAPFGRKGDNKSIRTFDTGALSFHFGMQVGNHDNDNDGVFNEVTSGELSALSIFVATAQTPFVETAQTAFQEERNARGRRVMKEVGCTECHIPTMKTKTTQLGFRFPEIGNKPFDPDTIFFSVDLTKPPMNFPENDKGGITVELFADLKRHDMGPSMAEFNGDSMFTTMRLWGVADTAPYLHDGRALTIRDAIIMHGADAQSEAYPAVQAFRARSASDKRAVLAFLNTLRSPDGTFPRLLDVVAKRVADEQGVDY